MPGDTPSARKAGLFRVALMGRCPRCGEGKLFRTWLQVADKCDRCGLSFSEHEQGDGPAFFGVLVVGAVTAIGAAIMEIRYAPPFWVHAVVWIPFVIIASLLSLRWFKAALVGIQYHLRKEDFR